MKIPKRSHRFRMDIGNLDLGSQKFRVFLMKIGANRTKSDQIQPSLFSHKGAKGAIPARSAYTEKTRQAGHPA
jgi:hypothetical protein